MRQLCHNSIRRLTWGTRLAAGLLLLGGTAAWAEDIFLLHSGGRVEGIWINRAAEPPTAYRVRTSEGAELVVPRDHVERVVEASPEELRYWELLPRMPDTAEGNWLMAEWCLKQGLREERTRHLEAVLELDPDHEAARRSLGFTLRDGKWTKPDEVMRQRGYVEHAGEWYLPQELELVKAEEARRENDSKWRTTVKRWHGWLGSKRDADAREQFAMLLNPAATDALVWLLQDEQDPRIQKILMEALGRLGGRTAELALAQVALTSENPTLREIARDLILELDGRWAYAHFMASLNSKDAQHIRRAAFALGQMANPEAIPALIDVVVTRHKVLVMKGNPGQISTMFGNGPSGGGTGFSTGGSAKVEQRNVTHAPVLDALKRLTGVNFGYDQTKWRAWYHAQHTPDDLNLRRDL